MVVRFDDFTEKLRCNVEKHIEYIHNNSKNSEEMDEKIIMYFMNLKQKDYSYYSQLVGLLLSDHYKQLYDKKVLFMLTENEQEKLNLYDELYDNESIMALIEDSPEILIELVYQMSEFNSLDYFVKRKMLFNCKDNLDLLKRFSSFNVFDYLYYCQKYSIEILQSIFDDYIKEGFSNEECIQVLLSTTNELGISDSENYAEIISELFVLYYKIKKNNLNIEDDLINILENKTALELLFLSNDDVYMHNVFDCVMNYNKDKLKFNSKDHQETINKLESIKRLVK